MTTPAKNQKKNSAMPITIDQYAGVYVTSPDWTNEKKDAAEKLLAKVNPFLDYLRTRIVGGKTPVNPKTGSLISGTKNGGFRPRDCPEGASNSSHKEGRGIDIYDPQNRIDDWINTFTHDDGSNSLLSKYGLYIEHPSATNGWCHMTDREPGSKRRVFYP